MKHRFFENYFSPAAITEWNDLDYSLCNAPFINLLKQNILKFIRLAPSKVFDIYNPHGPKLLTRLRLGLCHLRGHKFNHNFSDCFDYICIGGIYVSNLETISSSNVPYFLKKGKSS